MFLWLASTILTIAVILCGSLNAPKVFVFFIPIGTLPILLIARKLNIKIGGALGIVFSLLGIVLILASIRG